MKKFFENAEIELIAFDMVDVIATSDAFDGEAEEI
jgi:hypothetical protein